MQSFSGQEATGDNFLGMSLIYYKIIGMLSVIIKMVSWGDSNEYTQFSWGDSNEYTQYTF